MALRSTPSNTITSNGGTITGNTNFPNGINVYSELIATNVDAVKYYKLARVRFISTTGNPNGTYERALFNIKIYHTGNNLKIGNIKGYFYNAPNKRNLHSTSFLMVINNSGSTGFSAGDLVYFPLDSGSDANDYIVDIYMKVTNWAKVYQNTESATFENGCTLTIKPDGSTLINALPVAGTTTTIDGVTYTYGASVNGVITSDLNSQVATTTNAIPKFADTLGALVGSAKLSINASDQLVSTVPTGTAPFAVDSATRVTNLNASTVNGFADTALMKMVQGTNMKIYSQLNTEYSGGSSPLTGTIKITLPNSWTQTMLSFIVKGYNYSVGGAWTLQVGGFNNSGSWAGTTATLIGQPVFSSVRLAHDGTKCCILLGSTTTTWNYPKIWLDQVMSSHTTGWDTGYSISVTTDETGITTSATPTINAGVPITLTSSGQFLANNNIPIQARETGGTARNILNINASNAVQVGATTNATTINSTSTGLMHNNGTTTLNIVTEVTGTAAPTVTPNFAGQLFIDTTNKVSYVATGTSSSSDWTLPSGPNTRITPEGGIAIRMVNKTGANSVKGSCVQISDTADNGFRLALTGSQSAMGFVYEAGIADGSLCWVVINGIAEALVQDSTAITRGDILIPSDTVAGRVMPQAVPTTAQHFQEVGHPMESKTAGTNVLVKITIHFN